MKSRSAAAELSPNQNGGGLHRDRDPGRARSSSPPHTAEKAEPAEPRCIEVHRVLRIKLEWPGKDRWDQLRSIAAEVDNYRNRVIDAKWCDAFGFVPREDQPAAVRALEETLSQRDAVIREAKKLAARAKDEPAVVEDLVALLGAKKPVGRINPSRSLRKFSGRLSGDVYVPAEREAQGAWTVAVKKGVLGGWSSTPRFGGGRSIPIRSNGIKFACCGVDSKGNPLYAVAALLLKKGEGTPEDHRRMTFRVAKHTARDRFQGETLRRFADGDIQIDKLQLVLSPERGRLTAHLSYTRRMLAPSFGDRVAAFGPLDAKHDRLTLRVWHDGERIVSPRDYSRNLYHVRRMKVHFDGISRRRRYSIGKAKGSRRLLRRLLEDSFGEWARQYLHRWSADIVSWLTTQGVCRLDVLPIEDGDWPSYQLIEMLKFKGEAVGIVVVEIAKEESAGEDGVTYRAELAETKKEQRRVGKAREAARTLQHALARER